jgi:glycosyltransferase involved in cell wall biosynthesis/16S rRNA G966 N2-methylase RsmD
MFTYNGEKHLPRQLQSIVNQSMPPDEIVIVDDASSDQTVEIINEFISNYDYIKLFVNEKNLGINHSFLRAIRKSKNEIIIVSDQDDYWYKDRIQSINNVFKENPQTIMVSTNSTIFNNEKNTGLNVFDIYKPTKSFIKVFYKNSFIGCQIAIRKRIIPEFFEIPKFTYYDHILALLSLKKGHVSFISKPLSKYIRHEQTVTEIGIPQNYYESFFSRYYICLFFLKKLLIDFVNNYYLIKQNLMSINRSLAKRGLLKTLIFAINEIFFDLRFRTDTRSKVSSSILVSQGSNNSSEPYQGTNFTILKSIFSTLSEKIDLKNSHMVDYGSGMGRVLLSGLYYGINKVEGVEFDWDLHAHCIDNANRFCQSQQISGDRIKCHCEDAQLFKIPKGVNIFFLYNPFSSPVIDEVVSNIATHAETQDQDIIVVYVNPVFRKVFIEKKFILLENSSEEYDLYRWTS